MSFKGKTAFLTGAASGMSLLMSRCLIADGANFAMCDIDNAALDEKVAELNAMGPGRAIGLIVDVRDYQSICAGRDAAVEAFGSIDILVNFAGGAETRIRGTGGARYFHEIPIEVYDWGLDVNLKGQFYCDHAIMKQMAAQKSGVIINIGSITGHEGSPTAVAYSTSKSAAMHGLTKSVAQAGAPFNVRCNCVAPGPVLTRDAMARMKTMMGRAADPQEIVDLILYLCSDKAAFMTGENILIDGGRHLIQA